MDGCSYHAVDHFSQDDEKLRIVFANHGIPLKIVTDNGPSFTSSEFKEFMSRNGIKHITSAPYHPSSNGLAERAVQSFKAGIKKTPGESVQQRLSKFLFQYRITPHTTTGIPPAELLMNRRLRSKLDLLYPELTAKVENKQLKQKQQHDSEKPVRKFKVGESVFAQNFSKTGNDPKWLPGTIVRVTGPLSYEVELMDKSTVHRHVDNVRSRSTPVNSPESTSPPSSSEMLYYPEVPPPQPDPDPAQPPPPPPPQAPQKTRKHRRNSRRSCSQPPPPARRSSRARTRPNYYS